MENTNENKTELQRLLTHFEKEMKLPLLTQQQELELIERYQFCGDKEAHEKLIAHNVKFVLSMAKKYQNCGFDIDDLFSYGMIGLLAAIEKFDPFLGFKLSTSASIWIKQEIIKAIENSGRTIRLPAYLSRNCRKINKTKDSFFSKEERYPTVDELAELIPDLSVKEINQAIRYYESSSVTSLDATVDSSDEDDKDSLSNFIKSGYASPCEEAEQNLLEEALYAAMDKLTYREKNFLCMAYGLAGHEKISLVEIGALNDMSNERVRQIVRGAEKKLRNDAELIRFNEAVCYYNVA